MKLEIFKKLNIFIGVTGTLIWITLVFFVSDAFQKMNSKAWLLLIVGLIICSAIPYIFFKWVYWLLKRNKLLD